MTPLPKNVQRQKVRNSMPAWGFAVLTLLVFVRVLTFEFSELDDPKHLFENPAMLHPSLEGLGGIWSRPYFGMYIPFTYTVWLVLSVLSRFLWGTLRPEIYHLANVSLHGANAWLLYRILKQSTDKKDAGGAVIGALFFLLHPLQVQSVAWISALKDLLGAHFALWGLYQLQNGRRFLPFYLLACLAKPSFVIWPLFAKLLKPSFSRNTFSLSILIGLAFTALQKSLQPDALVAVRVPILQRFEVALDAVGFYLSKLVVPLPLVFDYGRRPDAVLNNPSVLFLSLGVGVCLLCLWRPSQKATLFFLAGILPVLGFIPFQFQKFSTVADHYAYLAVFGVSFALSQIRLPRAWAYAALAVLALFSMRQLEHWKTPVLFLEHNLKYFPKSFLAHNNLGTALYQRGRYAEAATHFHQARILIGDSEPELGVNEGASWFAAGEEEKGLQLLRETYARVPQSKIARLNLARALEKVGKQEEARKLFALESGGRSKASTTPAF